MFSIIRICRPAFSRFYRSVSKISTDCNANYFWSLIKCYLWCILHRMFWENCPISPGDNVSSTNYTFWSVKYHPKCLWSWNIAFFNCMFHHCSKFNQLCWSSFGAIAIFPFFTWPITYLPKRTLTKPKRVGNRYSIPIWTGYHTYLIIVCYKGFKKPSVNLSLDLRIKTVLSHGL